MAECIEWLMQKVWYCVLASNVQESVEQGSNKDVAVSETESIGVLISP